MFALKLRKADNTLYGTVTEMSGTWRHERGRGKGLMENTLKTMLTVWHVVAVQCGPSVMTGAQLKSSAILSYFGEN